MDEHRFDDDGGAHPMIYCPCCNASEDEDCAPTCPRRSDGPVEFDTDCDPGDETARLRKTVELLRGSK